jgi:hypothetical protein
VYWSQARIVDEVVHAANSEWATCANVGQLAAHLQARDALISCGPDSVAVEDTIHDDAEPDTRSTDEILTNGQLALPLATMSHQSASRRRESVSAIKADSPTAKPPSRSTPNVNDLFGG